MSLDFFNTYVPPATDLTTEQLQEARAAGAAWLAQAAPDLDTRPGSVFGDFGLNPCAQLLAALEVGLTRFRQDLDVAGVANGTVWDCDFVERRLLALGGVRQETLDTYGYVRFEFDQDQDYELSGGMRLLFNTSDVFVVDTPAGGRVGILRVGSTPEGPREFVLKQLASGRYAVVLPVRGYSVAGVEAGDDAALEEVVSGLVSVTAVSNFVVGRASNSVPEIARRTASTMYASGFASRGGVRRQMQQAFPDLTFVEAAVAGDPEMLRSSSTALGVGSGVVDIFVRSQASAVLTQIIRIPYIQDQSAVEVKRFIARWTPLARPTRLVSITWQGDASLVLSPVLYSRSQDDAKAPLLTSAYSELELLDIAIPMPMSDSQIPLIRTSQDSAGTYAWFVIQYEADPSVKAVSDYVEDEGPAGLSVLVRSPVQMLVDRIAFHYAKDAGVLFNTEQALQEITESLRLAQPGTRLSPQDLCDKVYSAGASSVLQVEFSARLKLSLADKVMAADAPDPSVDYAAADAAALDVPQIQVGSLQAIGTQYVDPLVGTADETLGTAGRRNIVHTILTDAIKFLHSS